MYYKRFDKKTYEWQKVAFEGYKKMREQEGTIVSTDEKGNEIILVPTDKCGDFISVVVTREDFEHQGFDGSKVTDYEMQKLADEMSEHFCEFGLFWDEIDEKASELNLSEIHRMIDTSFGEICLKPNRDDEGFLDMFQGDNWDDFIGSIPCEFDATDEEILEQIEEALYH